MDINIQTINDINEELQAEARAKIPGLSNSSVAEWKLWTYIMSVAVRLIQIITKNFVEEVNNKLLYQRQGTLKWYAEMAKKFQYGHNLIIKDDGTVGYKIDDPASRIVAVVSVVESFQDNSLKIKVARLVNNTLAEFTNEQRIAFSNYIENIKFAGTKIDIISTNPDLIFYNIDIYYNLAYDPELLRSNIINALNEFRNNIDFNGIIYKQKLVDSLLHIEGVVTIDLKSLRYKNTNQHEYQDINIKYETYAGYFNYDDESIINLKPITEL